MRKYIISSPKTNLVNIQFNILNNDLFFEYNDSECHDNNKNIKKNEMNYLNNHFKDQKYYIIYDKFLRKIKILNAEKKNQNFCKSYEILQAHKNELEQIIRKIFNKNAINDYLKKLNKNEQKITNFIKYFEGIITKKKQKNCLYYDKKYAKQTNTQISILLKILSQIVHLLKDDPIWEKKN
ncbi:conserved Plasmodium protein, unknown function [Plasmodium berghei]|uniref:Uncharacterized protein n=2 Tax=Plasmodium berghei TaxID=5821 RepID=A0A509ALI4_PLABA|nr:conserved Plasmodium protein, unknown function [Plasmodium berghei ANKA]CXI54933.1 conserved Plasmodium protein, unknown function [Plasmodium berghei]SCL95068.1 conserved Plasmodium protein, unknown function [Plasmodium berghei]SCM16166.1 conserved Plasmodium protein, unknown function [Plasmodium berghei]SCM17962.1 conserved Plasmodium protein, unknown function [Plasmodium berghei]SCN26342.1 conserved Plasmodium protein, unknown function [Plasmodium berghei]|eukprot:XP_034422090.1 conserved Plasmodium protein, unknown function [Plasmodium berghei ANKA]